MSDSDLSPSFAEHRFPCVACGADLRFDPSHAAMVCDHCGHSETLETNPWTQPVIRELDYHSALQETLPETEIEETRVTTCPNCAAQIEFTDVLHAKECPFCATPVVTDTGRHRHIKPRGVLPFALDEDGARDAMTAWLGQLWFAPNGLQQFARKHRRMQGVYVPYWTFDANTRSRYHGQRGTVYFETRTVIRNGKRQRIQVPKTRWRQVSGQVARFFDDVLVLASNSLPHRFTEALEPWDLSRLEPYNPEYLAGFRAEGYAIELEEGFALASDKMDAVIARDIRFDIGGDRQRIDHVDTQISKVTFKHILLPVWLAAYKYRGKTYRFVVNGATGKVQGERPWSAAKIAIAALLAGGAAIGIGYLYGIYGQ